MNMPLQNNELKSWDGHSRSGQAVYDRHFRFEMDIAYAQDIVSNPDPDIYSEEEIDAAHVIIEKFR